MKFAGWLLATTLAMTGVAATPATAQPEQGHRIEKTRYYHSDQKWRGSDRKWDSSDRKWDSNRRKWGWRTTCRTNYYRGHRERACRKLRYPRY